MATATKHRKKTTKSGSINKAQAIRDTAKEMGGTKVRPRDVIAALAEKGIEVLSPQVSSTLKAAGYRKARRSKSAASPKAHHASAPNGLSLEHLLAAKVLVAKLDGIEAAKKALNAWAKLM